METKRVMFKEGLQAGYLGRNGFGHSIGVEVHDYNGYSEAVFIVPILRNGNAARCEVRLPKDADILRALAAELNAAAEEV